jgi:uncharacterized membrane protein SpoIIM required for sporulation
MQSTELTIFCLLSFLFLCVGFIIGWLIRENMIMFSPRNSGPLHPEFFNEDGTVNADQVVSLRIEPDFYSDFTSEYEDLFDEDDEDD